MKHLFSIFIGVLIFVVYVWIVQQREGFEVGNTPSDVLKEIKKNTDTKLGNLNLSVYKQDYQNMITELDKYTDLTMVEMLTTNISTPQGYTNMNKFNNFFEFKKNLSEFKTTLNNMS